MRRVPLLLLFALASACLWRSYGDVMRVHLDVLSSVADKAVGNAAAGQRLTSNDVTELTYPLQRARQFAFQYRSYEGRESYARFVAALDRYQSMVEAIDATRGDETRWAAERDALPAQAAAWQTAVDQARVALAHET